MAFIRPRRAKAILRAVVAMRYKHWRTASTRKYALFSARYFHDFDDEGGQVPADRQDGVVLLLGLRLAL